MQLYEIDRAVKEADSKIQRSDWVNGLRILEDCKERCRREFFGSPLSSFWRACLELGRVYYLQGNYKASIMSYQEAMEYCYKISTVPDPQTQNEIMMMASVTLMFMGTCSEWFKASPYFNEYINYSWDRGANQNTIEKYNIGEKLIQESVGLETLER